MSEDKEIQKLSLKLNLMASILLDIKQSLGEKMSVKDKVSYLLKRGILDDEDISSILSIKKSHASKEKAMVRKEDTKQDGREEII